MTGFNQHLAGDLWLSVLADQAGMSERSFSRHYAEAPLSG
jgi:transcriptional regulator GlxA family with amidase domain